MALSTKGAVVIQNVVAHDDASSLPVSLKYLIGPFQNTLVSRRIILQMKDDEFLTTAAEKLVMVVVISSIVSPIPGLILESQDTEVLIEELCVSLRRPNWHLIVISNCYSIRNLGR